jgi:hypothetical protein
MWKHPFHKSSQESGGLESVVATNGSFCMARVWHRQTIWKEIPNKNKKILSGKKLERKSSGAKINNM